MEAFFAGKIHENRPVLNVSRGDEKRDGIQRDFFQDFSING